MTNYNERLDQILSSLENSVALNVSSRGQRGEAPKHSHFKAKQALTSLTKELVAEAKPETWADPDDTDELMRWQGYVDGIIDFEQNLLKELEEV